MVRNVNSSFTGVDASDVDPNALTRKRWFSEAVADTALVHDLITGKNTPPATLDHSGPGNGCPIGLPIANQIMGRDYSTLPHTASRVLWAVPSLHPVGESTVTIWVQFDSLSPLNSMRLEVRNASWAVVAEAPVTAQGNRLAVGTVTGLTAGTQYFYRLISDYNGGSATDVVGEIRIKGVFLGWDRKAPETKALARRLSSDTSDATELRTQTVSSATVIDFHDFDTAENQDGQAISGYHTTELAKNQHNLAEMLTGAPAGTNSTRTLTPSASQSAYYDHRRLGSEFSNMPLLAHIPVVGMGLGIVPEDGGTGGDGVGGFTTNRNAPGWGSVTTSATYRVLADVDCNIPYHTANKLRVQVLATSPSNTLGSLGDSFTAATYNGNTGAAIDSAVGAFTQLGSSNWWWADLTAIDHNPAGANRIRLGCAMTSGSPKADGSDLRIVGWTAFLED